MTSWSQNSVSAATAIRKAVALQRRTGMKNEYAMEAVADLFCLTPRRIRMWLYSEVINPSACECDLIMRRWWLMRDLEIERLRALAESVEREIEQERLGLQQFELPWGTVVDDKGGKSLARVDTRELASAARHLDSASRAEAEYRKQRRGPLK